MTPNIPKFLGYNGKFPYQRKDTKEADKAETVPASEVTKPSSSGETADT